MKRGKPKAATKKPIGIGAVFSGEGGASAPAKGVNEGKVKPVFFPAHHQARQLNQAAEVLQRIFPPDGKPPADMSNADLIRCYAEEDCSVSRDTILRAAGRRLSKKPSA